jgi:DNA-binding NtrC family response regulator
MTKRKTSILLVEDDTRYRERMRRNLEREGYAVLSAGDGEEALERLHRDACDLILTDIRMPGMNGIDLIRRIRSGEESDVDRDLPVVVLSSVDDTRTIRDAMRDGGAEDYILKEEELDTVLVTLQRVLEKRRMRLENVLLKQELAERSEFGEIVAVSPAMSQILQEVRSLAPAPVTVLITGESGVGKELIARAIHGASPRASQPFVDVSCPSLLGDNLSLSELFGHEKGAYTGATEQRKGKFELADGGTLFLDEVGDLPMDTQAQLLRVIETGEIERIGGNRKIRADVRLICATNTNLLEEMREGRFRSDLYHRINVAHIHLPPLRERPEDIPHLAQYFLDTLSNRYGRPRKVLDSGVLEYLKRRPWSGNVRELRHAIEGLIFKVSGDMITEKDFQAVLATAESPQDTVVRLPESGVSLEEINREAVIQALERAGWVQKDAAELLHITADQMNARIRKYGITHPSWKKHHG